MTRPKLFAPLRDTVESQRWGQEIFSMGPVLPGDDGGDISSPDPGLFPSVVGVEAWHLQVQRVRG